MSDHLAWFYDAEDAWPDREVEAMYARTLDPADPVGSAERFVAESLRRTEACEVALRDLLTDYGGSTVIEALRRLGVDPVGR